MKVRRVIALLSLSILALGSCKGDRYYEEIYSNGHGNQILVPGFFQNNEHTVSLELTPISEKTFLESKGVNVILDANSKWVVKYYEVNLTILKNDVPTRLECIDFHPDMYLPDVKTGYGYIDYHRYQIASMMDDFQSLYSGYLVAIDGVKYTLRGQ